MKLVGDVKQERHHRKLSEEIMKEMSSIIKTLQSALVKKDKLQLSMEETFKEGVAHEREHRLASEQSLAEIKAAYESLQKTKVAVLLFRYRSKFQPFFYPGLVGCSSIF
jgi:hypothetical protein